MSAVIAWMAAEGERRGEDVPSGLPGADENPHVSQNRRDVRHRPGVSGQGSEAGGQFQRLLDGERSPGLENTPSTSVSATNAETRVGQPEGNLPVHQFPQPEQLRDVDQERRIYRSRTVAMLRRYLRYSMETGRLPSLLGREWFRAQVTSYSVVTFEDRVIFVHDMETCLKRLDGFSRELIARYILQEHDRWATAKLLGCNEKTVRRLVPLVLDRLSEILLEAGLLDRFGSDRGKSCQGGLEDEICISDCEEEK